MKSCPAANLPFVKLYEALALDYKINGRKSARTLKTRWESHLKEFFGAMTAAEVTPRQVTRYIEVRMAAGAATASVNRELAMLKRMYKLALQSEDLAPVARKIESGAQNRIREASQRELLFQDVALGELASVGPKKPAESERCHGHRTAIAASGARPN